MKKKILSLILTVAMLLTVMPMALAADEYSDVQGHWGEAAIDRWTQAGVAVGREEGTFAPDAPMTRGEAAQVLANLLRLKKEANISQYGDMDPSSSYYTAMAQCVAAGIFNGTSDTTMSPDSELTREQLFTIFARALGVQPVSSSSVVFEDGDEVSNWAVGYINALAELGAVRGVGNSELQPKSNINRASVMSVLDQAISVYANTDGATVGESSGIVLVVADQVNVMGNVENLVVAGGSASVTGGSVENASLVGSAALSVSGSAAVSVVMVSGEGAALNVSGQAAVGSVAVAASATGASVEVTGRATVNTVVTQANSVAISGNGTVNSAVVSGSNTVVNTTGTNLTVSAGATGVTQNGSAVSGGSTVETKPSTPTTPSNPLPPMVHVHSYIITEIKAVDVPEVTVGLQYTCYAGDDTYVEWNGNAVAQIGDSYYVSLANALNAVNNGTVILLQDTILAEQVNISNTAVLDLNGKTVTVDSYGIIDLVGGGKLTVTGNGKMTQLMTSEIGYLFRADENSLLTIENGHFIAGLTCVQAGGSSVAKILGGTFEALVDWQNTYWHLNLIDNSAARITVSGGMFKNYNPAESHTENPVANFVAAGYTVTATQDGKDTWYTVTSLTAENSEAVVNGKYYENLGDAIAAADGATVTVLKNTSVAPGVLSNSWLGKTVVIDLNENTLTIGSGGTVSVGTVNEDNVEDYTITDVTFQNGNIRAENATYTTANFNIVTGSSLTIDRVKLNATGSVLFPQGDAAKVTVKDSTITTSGVYAIGTNAATTDNYNVVIAVENSTINMQAADNDSCGIMINVAGSLNVSNTTVNGQRQAVIVRAGTANITNCNLIAKPAPLSWVTESMYTGTWGSGDEVPYGALIVGNQTSSTYRANATVTLTDCTLKVEPTTEETNTFKAYAIYAIRLKNTTYSTSITASGTNSITGKVENYLGTATLTGLTVSSTETTA